ncbi:hypothetical protein LOTGIDRAFT_236716 [Lottia gigantea]|uniref:Direct IAP-binding protein with low pI n=1 Tax=Lottia gigantea TaxID=225164 RepID=V4B4B7_LOTGI|nr:hypothetical protein LOTGIDRAFT_236716 [Lottia gigantea]ESO83269.1 hypothetical protein LOTGIDRAFT_236716 [Lottia gigantea]
MSAPIKNLFVNIGKSFICRRCTRALTSLSYPKKLLIGSLPTFTVQNIIPQNLENELKKESDKENKDLSSSALIRNGSVWAVDAATSILTQTTTALIEIEKQYIQAVYKLTDILKYKISALNKPHEEQLIWDIILQSRGDLQEIKKKRLELELLYTSVEKLMDVSAEVAYAAGAEYASVSAGERLYSSQREIENLKLLTVNADMELRQIEAQLIEETSKHVEREDQRKKDEEKLQNENEPNHQDDT